ncbi:Arm DNA-binding domain-containing protein [Aquimarina macrocephali]|uniref:Arm DNA-binding domain-containing protein n=1 Tax=Aquimarina macrocephali TaxID=666563 RepID=UPI000465C82C|nr:Arm DNA-binding domain-containing protein [Aquimarina macrocephali]
MKATVKLYKNDGKSKGLYPVKLIITHQKKIKRKTIGYSLAEDWNTLHELPKTSHDDYEDLYGLIMEYRKKALPLKFKELVYNPLMLTHPIRVIVTRLIQVMLTRLIQINLTHLI